MAQQIIKKGIGDNQVGGAKIRLENNTTLRARNAADSADVDIIKVNASDAPELPNNVTLSATPTTANHVAKRSTIAGYWTEVNEAPTGLINGANVTYTLGFTPALSSLKVFLNGLYLTPTTDWTLSGVTLTMAFAPVAFQELRVSYLKEN
jgi:hypothetical protein